mmetsp:Transcript_8493/g.19981  ORF Transcript_8493/g.19981 Transcript_8493/m.19981 type:complete len:236 (+) Transcript_8493:1002-1709(+)
MALLYPHDFSPLGPFVALALDHRWKCSEHAEEVRPVVEEKPRVVLRRLLGPAALACGPRNCSCKGGSSHGGSPLTAVGDGQWMRFGTEGSPSGGSPISPWLPAARCETREQRHQRRRPSQIRWARSASVLVMSALQKLWAQMRRNPWHWIALARWSEGKYGRRSAVRWVSPEESGLQDLGTAATLGCQRLRGGTWRRAGRWGLQHWKAPLVRQLTHLSEEAVLAVLAGSPCAVVA